MKILLTLSVILLISSAAFSQNENAAVARALKNAVGRSLDNYTIYSYPTDNFGVGTVCVNRWVPRGTMVCDMVDTYGLTNISPNSKAWKNVNGFAFKGDGPSLTLVDSTVRAYGAAVIFPSIAKMLNIDLGAYKSNNKSINLRIDSAMFRYLVFDKFKELVNSNTRKTLTAVVDRKAGWIATSDFVFLDYTIEISGKDSSGLSIAAKLDTAINLGKLLSKGDSLGFYITKKGKDNFMIHSTKPVIFAVKVQKQKNIGLLSEEKSYTDWPLGEQEVLDPSIFKKPKQR